MSIDKKAFTPVLMGLLLVVSSLTIRTTDWPMAHAINQRLDGITYDLRLRYFLPDEAIPDPRIVIVDIDEKSLREIGRWPWSRVQIAKLLDQLFEHDPAAVGLDIVFSEPEVAPLDRLLQASKSTNQPLPVTRAWRDVNARIDGDQRLAESLRDRTVVLGYTFFDASEENAGQLPEPLMQVNENDELTSYIPTWPVYSANIQKLQQEAANSGFFLVTPDIDGVIRRAGLLMRYKDGLYPSLALAIMHQYQGTPPLELITASSGGLGEQLEGISLGGLINIPTDKSGQVMIPFQGKKGSFHYMSAVDVLHGRIEEGLLYDAFVLVGTTAMGLHDLRATPVDSVYPGVEIHANLLLAMLDESFSSAPDWAEDININLLFVGGIICALLFPFLKPLWLTLGCLLATGTYIVLSFQLWRSHGIDLSIILPTLLILLLAGINAIYGYLLETRGRLQLKSMFGQYVPPELVDEMNANPGKNYGFDGESREMTVLFCDIRNFTSMSESLPADVLKKMLNFFFTPMTAIIFDHRGTIDKYVGDMIMAFWGAPLADEAHQRHAIKAALEMLDKVEAMADEIAANGWPNIEVGIGLNTGLMNVGDMGSDFRRSYTVLGDAVNLGSRLEGLTKYYGVRLCISEFTKAGIDDYLFRKLDTVRVKGKNKAITIFEPICHLSKANEPLLNELELYHGALDDYYQKRWSQAEQTMLFLETANPAVKIYPLYLERIRSLKAQPPEENWDGVYTHTSK